MEESPFFLFSWDFFFFYFAFSLSPRTRILLVVALINGFPGDEKTDAKTYLAIFFHFSSTHIYL